jgi:undecaprenyl-diphosphatase
MDYFHALILSAIEGITEFLPVSSTGHLILASNILKIPQTDFLKSFEIIIQLGAIMAVAIIYWQMLVSRRDLWLKILIAFTPAVIIGFIFYGFIKRYLLGNQDVVTAALFLGGIALIAVDRYIKPKSLPLSVLGVRQSFLIGLFQSLSMIPGVSRSAATIVGGLIVGLNRREAVEFSFLLAIPTMAAATALDLYKSSFNFSANEIAILSIGFIGALVSALVAVRTFISFVQKHNFNAFGIYRICLAALYWILIIR